MTPQWDVYFMNDSLFAYLYQMPRKEGVVYVGKEAYERLVTVWEALKESEAYSTILFTEGEFYIEGDMLMVDGKSHPYEVVMPVGEDSNLPYFQDFHLFPASKSHQYPELHHYIYPVSTTFFWIKSSNCELTEKPTGLILTSIVIPPLILSPWMGLVKHLDQTFKRVVSIYLRCR